MFFLVPWGKILSSPHKWLQVSKKTLNMSRETFKKKKGLTSNHSCLTGNKNKPWQTSKAATQRSESWQMRVPQGFMGISNELQGGQHCVTVNFTKARVKQKSNRHTAPGQIPIFSPHMLSPSVNLHLMKRTWSKSYWFWDSLKGINSCLVKIKQRRVPTAERSQLKRSYFLQQLTEWGLVHCIKMKHLFVCRRRV